MEDLPHKMRLELAMIIHLKMYASVNYFKGKEKDKSFIGWMSSLLKPINIDDKKYIYKEGEEVTEGKILIFMCVVYFIVKGTAGYVLPRFNNKAYILIETGDHFGHVDLAHDKDFIDMNANPIQKKANNAVGVIRRFTVQAFEVCELLSISTGDLLRMKFEFPKHFQELFDNCRQRLSKDLILKFEVIKHSEMSLANKANDPATAIQSKFAQHFLGKILSQLNEQRTKDCSSPTLRGQTDTLMLSSTPIQRTFTTAEGGRTSPSLPSGTASFARASMGRSAATKNSTRSTVTRRTRACSRKLQERKKRRLNSSIRRSSPRDLVFCGSRSPRP